MNIKSFNCVIFIFLFSAFLSVGCAHKQMNPLQETPGKAAPSESKTKTPETSEEISKQSDVEDDFEDEFFEDEFETNQVQIADPLYIWNKGMYHFNDKLYFWVLKPLAKGYMKITPEIFRVGVKNFFHNLLMPIRFVNCLLQGKGNAAANEFTRFVINSTIGVLGLGDPASQYSILNLPDDEDLGQTFAKYGIGNGFFIVWPVLGPSTLRDTIGLTGDAFLNPINYVEPWEAALGMKGVRFVNRTSFHIGEYEALKEASVDPYVAMRNSYIQYREKKITK